MSLRALISLQLAGVFEMKIRMVVETASKFKNESVDYLNDENKIDTVSQ